MIEIDVPNREEQIQMGLKNRIYDQGTQIVAARDIPMKTIHHVIQAFYGIGIVPTLTGVHREVLSGVIQEPYFETDEMYPRKWTDHGGGETCTLHIQKEHSWVQCQITSLRDSLPTKTPPLVMNKDCASGTGSQILRALTDLQKSCLKEKGKYPWYYTKREMHWNPKEIDHSIKLNIVLDNERSYGDWVDIMQDAHELFPQIKVAYIPSVRELKSKDHCSRAANISDLTPIKHEALCHSLFSVGEDRTAEAFPKYHEWYVSRVQPQPELEREEIKKEVFKSFSESWVPKERQSPNLNKKTP